MNKTLFGLAYINYEYEINKKDLIDTYIPLFENIIISKNYKILTRENLYNDFISEYGIIIPIAVVEVIIKRMIKKEILKNVNGEIQVELSRFVGTDLTNKSKELEKEFLLIVEDIIAFSINNYDLKFSKVEIETALLSFLKEYDLDLLFGSESEEIFSTKFHDSRKLKYVIGKYIYSVGLKKKEQSKSLLKLAKGYSIASLMTYKDIGHFKGNLNNVDVYLDAPILYNLLGLNGEPNILLTQELIKNLLENGAHLKIFSVHHLELINSLADAIEKLRTKSFELNRCSRLIKTAVRENISPSQMQLKSNQLNDVLEKNKIEIVQPRYNPEDKAFQIDQEKFQLEISNLYNSKNGMVPWYIKTQIENDVETLANIFLLRRSSVANSLKNCKAILITNNEMLAFASKKFEKSEWPYKSTIPICLTDIFMATILWANYPSTNDDINLKKLMCECYYITDLDNRILKKYYEDVTKLHAENSINSDQFHLLNASNLSYELLEKKTLNDIELYSSSSTPREILDEIQTRYEGQLKSEQNINSKIFNNIDAFSNIIGKAFFIFIAVALIAISLIVKFYAPDDKSIYFIVGLVLAGFFTIFGILRWMEIIPTKKTIENKISEGLSKKIKSILIK